MPNIVPINFAYRERYLYSVAALGQKIEWMRTNPLVCVEADEIVDHDHWTSVVVRDLRLASSAQAHRP